MGILLRDSRQYIQHQFDEHRSREVKENFLLMAFLLSGRHSMAWKSILVPHRASVGKIPTSYRYNRLMPLTHLSDPLTLIVSSTC